MFDELSEWVRIRLVPVKKPLVRLMCHRAIGMAISRVFRDRIPFRGCNIETGEAHVDPAVKARLFWGTYEKAEVLFVKRYLREDLDVIELGSSLGVVSAHIAKQLCPGRRLICVEANPNLKTIIQRNVRLNTPATECHVVQAAIDYSEDGTARFNLAQKNTDSRLGSGTSPIDVDSISLRSLLTQYGVGEYVLVSDIEGAELGFITHDGKALEHCRQLIIELHDVQFGHELVKVDFMVQQLELHGFQQRKQRGKVYLFEK